MLRTYLVSTPQPFPPNLQLRSKDSAQRCVGDAELASLGGEQKGVIYVEYIQKLQGYIDKKNDRRLDDCIRYSLVASKKALEMAGLNGNGGLEVSDKFEDRIPLRHPDSLFLSYPSSVCVCSFW